MKNFHKRLMPLALVCLTLLVTGCAGVDLTKVKKSDAVSVVQVETYLDGAKTTGFAAFCIPEFTLAGEKAPLRFDGRTDSDLFVLASSPGRIELSGLFCSQNEVLFVKQRKHIFRHAISFVADAGRVNYAGKLKINYRMSSFGAADFFGVEEIEGQDFHVRMKLLDDYRGAQQEFLKKYKELPAGFSFKKTLFGSNPLFDN